jgi:integrase/recombinase XerD
MEMFLKWCKRSRITAPTQITRTSLESYQRYLFQYRKKNGQPLAVASQHARLAPLKVWFKWLAYRKYVAPDPAAELELPRVGYKLPSVLNKDEAERVLRCFRQLDLAPFDLFFWPHPLVIHHSARPERSPAAPVGRRV